MQDTRRFQRRYAQGKTAPLAERFWAKVDRRGPDECWPWLASLSSSGYGQFQILASMKKAHRVALELHTGQALPAADSNRGTIVMHTCDNKLCCNPAHLRASTQLENVQDMDRKQRRVSTAMPGEKHPQARLTRDKVRRMRELSAQGRDGKAIAKLFGVSHSTACRAIRGATWT